VEIGRGVKFGFHTKAQRKIKTQGSRHAKWRVVISDSLYLDFSLCLCV